MIGPYPRRQRLRQRQVQVGVRLSQMARSGLHVTVSDNAPRFALKGIAWAQQMSSRHGSIVEGAYFIFYLFLFAFFLLLSLLVSRAMLHHPSISL